LHSRRRSPREPESTRARSIRGAGSSGVTPSHLPAPRASTVARSSLAEALGHRHSRSWCGRRPLVSSSGARPLHRRGRARVGAARSRCRGAAALLSEAKHQPRPRDPVLAHLRADDREQAAPHTQRAPRVEHGSNSQGLPRRADAISKDVRRPDTGSVVRHVRSSADLSGCFHGVQLNLVQRTGPRGRRRGVAAAPGPASSGLPKCVRTHVGCPRRVNRE
jgi:hypothetical protein